MSSITNARTRPGVDCDSDHVLVTANLRMKVYKNGKKTCTLKYDLDKLEDNEVKEMYTVETENKFSVLLADWKANETMPNEIWTEMSKVYKDAAESKLGLKKGKPKKPFITEEVFQLAKEKSKARKNNNWVEYKRLKKEIRQKIRRDKVAWLEHECSQITQANIDRKSKLLFQQVKKVKSNASQVRNQCINDKAGTTLTEMDDVLQRWHEYGTELFDTTSAEPESPPDLNFEHQEPIPLLEEITSAIEQLKSGKSPGLDGIPAELLKHSGEAGVAAIHHLCTKIWETCTWPDDWKLQEFVMLYKKGNAKECGNYRTIALISHASKILLIVILNRMRRKVEEELSDCQAGYRSNRGTIDMLFSLQLLIEKVKNSEEEAFIIFIEYNKVFDSVNHNQLFTTMIKMGFPTHLVSLIAALYDDQKATIRWNGEHSQFFKIRKGVRQGCILSPHLFNTYTEQVMRDADIDDMGIRIGGRNITDMRYADDTGLLSSNITSSRRMLYRVDAAGKAKGLGLNAPKTNFMHLKGKESQPDHFNSIKVNGTVLERVDNFKYLGSIKSSDGTCLQDVKARIAMAKQKMIQLNNVWKDRSVPMHLKMHLLKCLVWPVLMYGCEAWTIRKQEENRLNAAEMWLYRRLLRISWQDRRTNESVLEELLTSQTLLKDINRRKLKYLGHAIRNPRTDLMASIFQGRVEGKRNRGRPSMSYMDNIKSMTGLTLGEVVHRSRDREDWRAVVARYGAATDDNGVADR